METIDTKLNLISERLSNMHNCHTIILYGSHATGDATASSDFDVCGFREGGEEIRDCEVLDGIVLDAWIYPEEKAKRDFKNFLHVRGGKVLKQKDTLASNLLSQVDSTYNEGPKPLEAWERTARITWLNKTLARAKRGDIEGNYRLHSLLVESLQYYFELRGMWYQGSKKSFQWIAENDANSFELYQKALSSSPSLGVYEQLIANVIPKLE